MLKFSWAWIKLYNLEAWCLILQSRFGLELSSTIEHLYLAVIKFDFATIGKLPVCVFPIYKKGWKLKIKAYPVTLWQDMTENCC